MAWLRSIIRMFTSWRARCPAQADEVKYSTVSALGLSNGIAAVHLSCDQAHACNGKEKNVQPVKYGRDHMSWGPMVQATADVAPT